MNDKARTLRVDDVDALLAIDCQGARHRVAIGVDGKLRFYDHSAKEIGLINDLYRQAGKSSPPHECARLMADWAGEGRLPEPFRRIKREQESRGNRRRTQACIRDKLTESPKARFRRRTRDEVDRCLEALSYRVSAYAHDYFVEAIDNGLPRVDCRSERTWDAAAYQNGRQGKSETHSKCWLYIPIRWLAKVHAEGLAMVDGKLVLDVLDKRADGRLTLLMLKQGRGFKLTPAGAVYDPKSGRLDWL